MWLCVLYGAMVLGPSKLSSTRGNESPKARTSKSRKAKNQLAPVSFSIEDPSLSQGGFLQRLGSNASNTVQETRRKIKAGMGVELQKRLEDRVFEVQTPTEGTSSRVIELIVGVRIFAAQVHETLYASSRTIAVSLSWALGVTWVTLLAGPAAVGEISSEFYAFFKHPKTYKHCGQRLTRSIISIMSVVLLTTETIGRWGDDFLPGTRRLYSRYQGTYIDPANLGYAVNATLSDPRLVQAIISVLKSPEAVQFIADLAHIGFNTSLFHNHTNDIRNATDNILLTA